MNQRLQISPDVMFRELEGEAVLLDLKSQRYFGLDAVGTRSWQLLSELGSTSAVTEALLLEFDVSRRRLEEDLQAFFSRLTDAGLVHLVTSEPATKDGEETENGPAPP